MACMTVGTLAKVLWDLRNDYTAFAQLMTAPAEKMS